MPNLKSELRKDYVQEKYVIIAPRRGKRPHDTKSIDKEKIVPRSCVFCPENIDKNAKELARIKNPKKPGEWLVKVIPNKFPAVSLENKKAYGIQEVVIETPDHLEDFEDLSLKHINDILDIYAMRTNEISKNKKIEYILIFKNNGGKAGASLQHPHSQIFATNFIPPHLFDKSQKMQEYKLKHGSCVYCDVIKKESKGPRLIWHDKNVIAFCPYASMHNYEVWIITKRHLDNVTMLNNGEQNSIAKILKSVLGKISDLGLPYNYYFHQVVNDEDQHLYMKIVPRGSVWAGVEIGSGVIINPILPEEAAKYYRK